MLHAPYIDIRHTARGELLMCPATFVVVLVWKKIIMESNIYLCACEVNTLQIGEQVLHIFL